MRMRTRLLAPVLVGVWAWAASTAASAQSPGPEETARSAGVPGGLCVQVGGDPGAFGGPLAATGRYLVHILHPDAATVEGLRRRFGTDGRYGLFSIGRLTASDGLPYTERLVNLVVVVERPKEGLSASEIARVLCPNGAVLAAPGTFTAAELEAAGIREVGGLESKPGWLAGHQPWPSEMGQWSHARHAADGNPVSSDTIVGPPRRIRWVVGAQAEVRGVITAGGRNYYAGTLARDSFNGLRLWNHELQSSPSASRFMLKNLPNEAASPVASERELYVVAGGKLTARDGATGRTLREYPEAGSPREVLHDGGFLVVTTGDSVRALDAATAKLRWRFAAETPRLAVTGDRLVAFIDPKKKELIALDRETGKLLWKRSDYPWIPKVKRLVYHRGMVACEVSTFSNDGADNAIHVVSAEDGQIRFDHSFLPAMSHRRQARAMFVGDRLWFLHGGRDEKRKYVTPQVSAIDVETGSIDKTLPAALAHCFPPVASPRYMFSGELNLTDLESGQVTANRITKGNCSPDSGWVPANGLVYVTPKHCVCWPMLRGYAALAPARADDRKPLLKVGEITFVHEKGVEGPADPPAEDAAAWPAYRHDGWRSGATSEQGPSTLKPLWSTSLGVRTVKGPIPSDWDENPFIQGPLTAPVVADGRVVVARPDAHEVVSLDARDGTVKWRFTADGRVDTAPTLHRGLCIFGTKSGWVTCLRADDGRMVWRLRAAPRDERIVAYGQLESPWPVPGSVLVVDGVVYFAAGRQSFADGGILVFAVDPADGRIRWVRRLDTVPQKGFYNSSGLEFDNFDLLHREGDHVAMSRWRFDRKDGEMSVQPWTAFAKLDTDGGTAMVPQGSWSYAPRHQTRTATHSARRPLVVFRGSMLLGSLQEKRAVYRRDFDREQIGKFETKWLTGWAASKGSKTGKLAWRSERLSEGARWKVELFGQGLAGQTIDAMALAGERLYIAGSRGKVMALSTDTGAAVAERALAAPIWDGLAVAGGRLFVSTRDGHVVCLGGE